MPRKLKTAPAPHPAFAAMLAESARTGLPRSFERDLTVHDRAWVEARDPKAPFMWALRECGTHLWDLWLTEAGKERRGENSALALIDSIARGFEGSRFYLWDGVALLPFTSAETARAWVEGFMERERERAAELAAKFCGSDPRTPHEWRGAKCTFCDFPKPTES